MTAVRARSALAAAPFALYLYPFIGGLAAISETAVYFGRWSPWLAAFNAFSAALYLLAAVSIARQSRRGQLFSLGLLVALSFAAVGNNGIRALPAVEFVLPAVRLAAGASLMASAAWRGPRAANALLTLGSLLLGLALMDAALGIYAHVGRAEQKKSLSGFRDDYDLGRIGPRDVVLVGDSFVWGTGVAKDERFGERLEAAIGREGARVYSLGLVGASVNQYAAILESLPAEAHPARILVCFYPNDMPEIPSAADKLRQVLSGLRAGSQTAGFAGDLLGRFQYASADGYHRHLAALFDKKDPTYGRRFELLRAQMKRVREAAARHSDAPPVLALLPIMVDFREYPLREAHADLAALGEELGYEVLDLLPVFGEKLVDGSRYLLPNDNHFNAEAHRLVADSLRERLAASR